MHEEIDVLHQGTARSICCHRIGDVIVDPGPESSIEGLLTGLGDERPRAILLTHIHLDHAGATGALVRRWPDVEVWVHANGARHLVDPSRLIASATRIYGDRMDALWGDIVPVPEERLVVLEGGERRDGFRIEYTPGHASHHVCYLHEDSGIACVGDVGGVRIGEGPIMPPTPPPDIDLEQWAASVELVEGWEPSALAITHFGTFSDVRSHLDRFTESLARWGELGQRLDRAGFEAAVRDEIGSSAAYLDAMPPETLYGGLDRYWSKRVSSPGS